MIDHTTFATTTLNHDRRRLGQRLALTASRPNRELEARRLRRDLTRMNDTTADLEVR